MDRQEQQQRQQDGAERIDVLGRVQAQTSRVRGGRVAEILGDVAMGGFVQGNCKKNGYQIDRDGPDDRGGIVIIHGRDSTRAAKSFTLPSSNGRFTSRTWRRRRGLGGSARRPARSGR